MQLDPQGGTAKHAMLTYLAAGVRRADPQSRIARNLTFREGRLFWAGRAMPDNPTRTSEGRLFLVALGKASQKMIAGMYEALGQEVFSNVIAVGPETNSIVKHGVTWLAGSHPNPDEKSLHAGLSLLGLKEKWNLGAKDTVIAAISGGGSSLACAPEVGLQLDDLLALNRFLLRSGLDILEVNRLRAACDALKGGGLRRALHPAHLHTFIVSDVPPKMPEAVSSGPTLGRKPNPSSICDWLRDAKLLESLPESIRAFLESGGMKSVESGISEADCESNALAPVIVSDNAAAVQAAGQAAEKQGWNPTVFEQWHTGTFEEVLAPILSESRIQESRKEQAGIFAVSGGECTPRIPGNSGTGGRNMHLATYAALQLLREGRSGMAAAAGTDGVDFLSGFAGAIVTPEDIERVGVDRVEYALRRADTFPLLKQMPGCLIKASPTGTNVADIFLFRRD